MRKYSEKIQQFIEMIYVILLISPLITMCFTLAVNEEGREILDYLYLQSLLIVIPVVIFHIMVKKCKYFVMYLGLGIGTVIFTGWLAGICGGMTMSGNKLIIFQALLVIETLIIWGIHFHDRMQEEKVRHEPSFGYSAVFVVYYVIGVLFDGRSLCDIAFYSCIFYLLLTTIYHFFSQTKRYISLNHEVKNVPVSRLFGIGGAMLASLGLLLFLAIIPSAFAGKNRYYTDLRDMEIETPKEEENWETGIPQVQTNGMSMEEQLELMGVEEEKMPEWVDALFKGIVYFLMFCAVMMCVKEIFRKLSQFQESFQENEDVIENITEEKEKITSIFSKIRQEPETQREKIRRLYRKTIRKSQKERPCGHETPQELERAAGLAEDEQMKALHIRYEEARYSDESRPIAHTE